jgi:hypothetical protein
MPNTISGPNRSRVTDPRDEEHDIPVTPPFRREYAISGPREDWDATLVDFVRNAAPRPTNDQILYVGVNPESASIEASALRRLRPDTKTILATNDDVVDHRGARFDLATPEGRQGFVASLGLTGQVGEDVAKVLANSSRGTLARIATVWSAAERGGAIPSRLLLSGHSTGGYVSGGGNMLLFADVQALAKAMPQAARQIEDIHISGCFSNGNARDNAAWRAAFPNVKTMWAYDGFSPAAPVHHFAAWEAATRGRTDRLLQAPWLREQSVACWSLGAGYVDRSESPEALERAKRSADGAFATLMAGTPRIKEPTDEPASSHYGTYRSLANRSERSDRPEMARRADQLLALRHYETTVRGRFAETYASQIEEGFRAIGLPAPDYRTLTRAEALAASRRVHDAIARTDPVPPAARELETIVRGLDTFDTSIVKPEWSTHAQ